MLILKHFIFVVFEIMQLCLGFFSIFGPFIAATKNPIEDFFKYTLMVVAVMGPIFTLTTYLRWTIGHGHWVYSGGFLNDYLERMNFFEHPWVCMISPGFFLLSLLLLGSMYLSGKFYSKS